MNRKIDLLVEETIDSFNNIKKVEAPTGLNQKILTDINQLKIREEVYLFRHPQWLIAALVIGIVCNVYFAISFSYNVNTEKNSTETSDLAIFENHFKLASSTNLFE